MAGAIHDTLAEYLGEHTPNDRFDIWLYHYLTSYKETRIQQIFGGTLDKRVALAEELKRLGIAATTVLNERQSMLLPEAEFDWLVDSERFFSWLLTHRVTLSPNAHSELRHYGSQKLSYRDACLAYFDTQYDTLYNKSLQLSSYKKEWQIRLQVGEEFSWVSGENEEEKVRLAFKEVSAAFAPIPIPQISSTLPIINISLPPEPKTHEGLLIHLDRLWMNPWVAKEASKKAKAKWSQLKYKSNKNKSQLNVHISTEATKKLAAIAEKHHLSKAKVIEYLINAESEKGLYISEKMAAWLRGDVE